MFHAPTHTRGARRFISRRLVPALALTLLPLLGAAEPAVVRADGTCTTSGGQVQCTFASTGAEQTFTVPAGVTTIQVMAIGAAGGKDPNQWAAQTPSGRGAEVTGALSGLSGGQILYVEVGGPGLPGGRNATGGGGFNGGGSSAFPGGGGGGASDVRTCSRIAASCATASDSLHARLIVAAGGGGVGGDAGFSCGVAGTSGGDAGTAGGTSSCMFAPPPGVVGTAGVGTATGGGPASQNAGGPGGTQSLGGPGGTGQAGSLGQGGIGNSRGGGGGGGLFGGGGGADAVSAAYVCDTDGCDDSTAGGGGGGGSSFVPTGGTFGLSSEAPSITISYSLPDTTPPTAKPTQSPAPNVAGWNNADVTVTWNWTDDPGGSGVDANHCTTSSTSTGEGANLTLSATCQDLAGNVGSASYGVNVDKTAPTISAAASTQPNNNGWYNANITVHFTCNDALAGILSGACPVDQVLNTEGASVNSTAETVTDAAGNSSPSSNVVTANIDKTAPTITASLVPATPASTGWYNQSTGAPTVSFNCSDALSGLHGSCPAPFTFPEGANARQTASVSDNAGNSASTGVSAINVDLTAPTVSYSGDAGSYTVDQQVQIACTVTDSTSGVASSTCQNISGPAYSYALGLHSYSATATDKAGNTGSGLASFTVTVSPSSLQTLVNRFCTDPSVSASLDQDLNNIAHASNADAKAGMLQGFTQLVEAQTGKSLTNDQANVLIKLADAL